MNTNAILLLACASLSTGCAVGDLESNPEASEFSVHVGEPRSFDAPDNRVEIEDAGELCIFDATEELTFLPAPGGEQRFVPGERLRFRVAVPGCLSASCDVDRHASCEVTTKGNVLTISSYLRYEETDAEQCTADCGRLWAFCESEPLALGAYEIVHGAASKHLTVPSTQDACAPEACRDDDDCTDGYCEPTSNLCLPRI